MLQLKKDLLQPRKLQQIFYFMLHLSYFSYPLRFTSSLGFSPKYSL